MSYQDYTNFSELASTKAGQITSLGFDLIGFIGNHTLGFAITLLVLFLAYRIWVVPIMDKQKEMDEEDE